MHVLLIHQAFASLDEPGGTRHHELSRYLASHGHRVTIIASSISYLTGTTQEKRAPSVERQAGEPGVTILKAYTYPALHRSFPHRILSFLSFMFSSFFIGIGVKEVDLVWGTSPPIFQGLTAWAIARLKRVPFLFEVRDLWPAFAMAVGVLKQPLLIRASEWLERFLYHHTDLVIVNSPGFIQHVRTRGADRVELVPNGADAAMFDPQADGLEFRQAWDLQAKFVALYAGAHGLSNDLGVILESAHILRDQLDISIVLLGDGKDKPSLIAQAAKMKLTNIKFLPPIPKTQMPLALAASDACIAILKPIPMYATVYPNKVFDYMAAGRPVILAIEGVIQEIIEETSAGIAVKPGDPVALANAIRFLAENPQERKAMGLRGRQCVETQFNRPALAEKLTALMETLSSKV